MAASSTRGSLAAAARIACAAAMVIIEIPPMFRASGAAIGDRASPSRIRKNIRTSPPPTASARRVSGAVSVMAAPLNACGG
jgi:hypothetical protein